MGTIIHHAIVVTSWGDYTKRAHEEAVRCCGVENVSAVTPKAVNDYSSFLVAPDGSKEGWPDSAAGDARRATFVAWLHRQRHSDGSTPYYWVLIEYGERYQREGAAVLDHGRTVNVGDRYKGPHDLDPAKRTA